MSNKFKLALIQLRVTSDKNKNISNARRLVLEAAKSGANVISLPECFNSPYGTQYFPKYAEPIPQVNSDFLSQPNAQEKYPTIYKLSEMAREAGVYLVGGSIPETSTIASDKFYNTCTVFNSQGQLIAKHRKMHLFDINLPTMKFKESDNMLPGDQFTTFSTPYCKIGIGICYDMRFPEMAMILAGKMDCKMILYPAAFNMTTGPLHWELLQRGRALDNQIFVATCAPARDETGSYVAWGHSTVVNPSGQVIATTDHSETTVYCDIDLDEVENVRNGIPILKQKRNYSEMLAL